jgi:hypothetical protein
MPGADLVEQAVQAIQSGEHERAQGLLAEQLAEHPQDDRAWFWLSASVSDPDKKRYCLERALSIRPTNEQARRALGLLDGSQAAPPAAVDLAPAPPPAPTPPPADQPVGKPQSQLPAIDEKQPPAEVPAGATGASKEQAPGASPRPSTKKRTGLNGAQTCLLLLLAVSLLVILIIPVLTLLRSQGLTLPEVGSPPGQAPGDQPPLTFFLFPATWTPAPLQTSLPAGPAAALTPAPTLMLTPLPSLTPISPDRLMVIGRSAQNRPIEVYRFGSGLKERLIIAGIHGGDEANTIALADQLIDHLRQNRALVPPGYTLYILRSLNPDGEALGSTPAGRLNANGVDLNRNFDVGWKADWKSDGCSSAPGTAGPGPGSEPETQALKDFIGSHRIEVLISYHSAYLGVFASGEPAQAESARLAQAIHEITVYPYPPVQSSCEYTGTLVDWAAAHGVPAAVDIELNSKSDAELEINLKLLPLLFSFEPAAPPSPPPASPTTIIPTLETGSPTAAPSLTATQAVTPTLVITTAP